MIVEAVNCARAYAARAQPLAADFVSDVIDFRDMPIAAIQFLWSGGVGVAGTFKIYGSLFPDVATFDGCELDGIPIGMDNDGQSNRLWSRAAGSVTFRYALVRYFANGTTGGLADVVAMGKKT